MDLLKQTEALWSSESEVLSGQWVTQLSDNKARLERAVKLFREWPPLYVYLSVTRAVQPRVSFSVRYQGQEVASLQVTESDEVRISISADHARTNARDFGLDLKGTFNWRSSEATRVRKHFAQLSPEARGRVPEHRVESEFLRQMANPTAEKFAGTFRDIQPVLFAGCPFQFPLPLSGSSGLPKTTRGNIDILARRGTGRGTKLSLWELKKPEVTAHAIEQSYIYAVTLLKMLRSASGKLWYSNVIGFSGKLPEKLVIEAVPVVSLRTEQKRTTFRKRLEQFSSENSMSVGNDRVKMCLAFYSEDPLRIDEWIEV
jgi:hypothetical protein